MKDGIVGYEIRSSKGIEFFATAEDALDECIELIGQDIDVSYIRIVYKTDSIIYQNNLGKGKVI